MFTDHVSQFFDGVIPAYKYYVELSKKVKKEKFELSNVAIQSANMLFHYRDALEPILAPRNFKRYDVAKLCPDYDLLGDAFNAVKHKNLQRANKLIRDASAVEHTLVLSIFPNIDPSLPEYNIMHEQVRIDLLNGSSRDFLELQTVVINFWADFLLTEGLTNKKVHFRYEGDDYLTPHQADARRYSARIYAQEIGGGYAVFIARKYNLKLNKFERLPFDETGKVIHDLTSGNGNYRWKAYTHIPDMKPDESS